MFVSKGSLIVGDKPKEWIVDRPIVYASQLAKRVIFIPAGFTTDLASIPRLVQVVIEVNGRERLAAAVHDFLYGKQFDWCSRKLADDIFLEALTVLGETISRKYLMYSGVRVGGWVYWNKCSTCDYAKNK